MRSLLRRLALCLSCIALAIWYSHATFYRDPGSVFFDPKRAFEQKYSQYRKAEVQKFVDTGDGIVGKAGKDASLCVALSSVRRQHSQYLEVGRQIEICSWR